MKWVIVAAVGALSLTGCGSGSETNTETAAKAGAQTSPPEASSASYAPVDACALLTKAEVEELAGKKVLDGRKEELAQLVSCSFGDPEAPQVAGRALSHVLAVSVMTGREDAYFAGAAAQVKDTFLLGRKNAASAETVSGLGDDAYWDSVFHKLSVLKGVHLVEVEVEAEGMNLAKAAATKALGRLPQ